MITRKTVFQLITLLFCTSSFLFGCASQTQIHQTGAEQPQASTPVDADPELMARLSAELERAMAEHDSLKRIAAAPIYDPNRVFNFHRSAASEDSSTFNWSYRNQGDYDQNGEVNLADLAQVALHFGVGEGQEGWTAAQPADGDRNGEVNLADVATIAICFRNTVQGYIVQASMTPEDEQSWESLTPFPLSTGVMPDGGGILEFSIELTDPPFGNYFRVVPYLGDPEDSPELGVASNHFLGESPTNWSMFGGNPQHTHRSPWVGPQTNNLKWEFQTTGAGFDIEDVAVGTDGTVYVASGPYLRALNPDGTLLWSSESWSPNTRPVLAPDGTIYVGSKGNRLFAFNPDGSEKWNIYHPPGAFNGCHITVADDGTIYVLTWQGELLSITPEGEENWDNVYLWDDVYIGNPSSPAVIGSDGTIFACNKNGEVFAFDKDGNQLWSYSTSELNYGSSLAIDANDTLYLGCKDRSFNAINPDGTLKWMFEVEGEIRHSSAIGSDGTIYFITLGWNLLDSCLFAINSDGSVKWQYTGNGGFGFPSVGADGTVYLGSPDNNLKAINPDDGSELWSYTADRNLGGLPVIGPDGTVFVACNVSPYGPDKKGKLFAVNPGGSLKWSYTTGGFIYSSPAIGADGVVYFGSYDDHVYAVHPDGSLKWSFKVEDSSSASPAIGADGTVYVHSWDGLFAINPNGSQRWFQDTKGGSSSPMIGTDGTIYLAEYGGLLAINPDSSMKWLFTIDDSNISSPAIGFDGTIYMGSYDNKLYAINPDGTEKWSFITGDHIYSSPAIGADGTIYVGSYDGNLYAIYPDGSQQWSFTTGGSIGSSPAIGADGIVYVNCSDGTLNAIFLEGTLKWSYPTRTISGSTPAIGADGKLYIGNGFEIASFSPEGRWLWRYYTNGRVSSSPAIGPDGTLYVGSQDGKLYVFGD